MTNLVIRAVNLVGESRFLLLPAPAQAGLQTAPNCDMMADSLNTFAVYTPPPVGDCFRDSYQTAHPRRT